MASVNNDRILIFRVNYPFAITH